MPIRQIPKIKKSILRSSELFYRNLPKKLTSTIVQSTNCYAYSLGIMYPETYAECLYTPGFTEELEYEVGNTEDLMDKVEMDLRNLGITFRRFALKDEKILKEDEYLIKVFYYDSFLDDFHFIRQDKHTGMWFHKTGWYDQPELVSDTPYDEPTIIDISYHTYNPVGYFAITEGKS